MSSASKSNCSRAFLSVPCCYLLVLVLSAHLASGDRFGVPPRAGSSSGAVEASSGDKMSSSAAVSVPPPHRFHAIFRGSSPASSSVVTSAETVSVAAAAERQRSPATGKKMLAIIAGSSSTARAGNSTVNNGTNNHKSRATTKLCREGCLEKRSIKDILCTQQRECAMCWDVCNRNHQIRKENELAQRLLLSLSRMVRNESVVTADIEWTTPEELLEHQPHSVVPSPLAASENVERLSRIARDDANPGSSVSKIIQALSQAAAAAPDTKPGTTTDKQTFHQCLVSWEISGGGLTGNLLTETAKVELSLWPNTKYHVHVTCRNKETDQLIRSPPLLIDTSEATIVSLQGTTTTLRPLSINSVIEEIDVVQATSYSNEGENSSPTETRQQQQQQLQFRRPHLWPIYNSELPENSKEILILGVFVAILAFVLIVLTVVILVRRKQEQIEDRELLIESEILPKILHV
ncbi:uncharacterized protein LOC131425688 [Malaya genurostris]|uniref:uncharacterized protein LOC131425688 n=1 Tax=Malaya genurostris TaxID=325434 RepID=UPI0026F3CDF7|nr:uncharacterized protein LOC131425688 [Malaya genurostris]